MNGMDVKNATILVVDDNPTNLNVLSDCLTEYGFTVLVKKDGEKALALTDRILPDIILLDILMPKMDGFETCRRLKAREKTRDIPVIFMTALSETVDKLKGFKLGAVDYITKPFHQEEVLARVKAHLTIQDLKKSLRERNRQLGESLERERKLSEDLRLNLSLSLPHELRTPLNAVIGFSQFLMDPQGLPSSEKIVEYASMIYKSGLRLNRLVENSLLYANLKLLKYTSRGGLGGGPHNYLNSREVISSIALEEAEAAGRVGDLFLDLIDADVRISRKNFQKILSEILGNAFKFSLPGSPVRITTSINGNLCMFGVADRGRGMAKEQILNVGAYMQFGRSTHEQQGMGLGLVIANLLTLLEGGVLSIDSEPEKGTMVSIVLHREPRMPSEDDDPNKCWFNRDSADIEKWLGNETDMGREMVEYESISPRSMARTKRILVVDKLRTNRAVMKNVFSHAGFEVMEARDLLESLDMIGKDKPDLVFTDISELESFETLRSLGQSIAGEKMKLVAVMPDDVDEERKYRATAIFDETISTPLTIPKIIEITEKSFGIVPADSDSPADSEPVPSPHILEIIHELAVRGDIDGILKCLDEIGQSGGETAVFVEKIRKLAKEFQMRRIREFVSALMKQGI